MLTTCPAAPPLQVIAGEVLGYLRESGDEVARRDAVRSLCDLAERYAPDHQWFVDTMNELFEVAGARRRAGGGGGSTAAGSRACGWNLAGMRIDRWDDPAWPGGGGLSGLCHGIHHGGPGSAPILPAVRTTCRRGGARQPG